MASTVQELAVMCKVSRPTMAARIIELKMKPTKIKVVRHGKYAMTFSEKDKEILCLNFEANPPRRGPVGKLRKDAAVTGKKQSL
jgi:hypothetical protein